MPARPAASRAAIRAGRRAGSGAIALRRLGSEDLPAVAAHLCALDRADRRDRFQAFADDAAIRAYVRGLDSARICLIGAVDARTGRVVGLAEAHLDCAQAPVAAEIAVSVLAPWRGRGLGRRLVEAAADRAFARGTRRVELHFDRGNRALARLARALGATLDACRGHAVLECGTAPVAAPVKRFTAAAQASA